MKNLVKQILDDPSLDNEDAEESKSELIEQLITSDNWPEIQQFLFEVLSNDDETYSNWHTCLEVFWGAVLDQRPVDGDRIIALAFLRLKPDEHSLENNLAWSLTCKIKGEDYFSGYSPFEDPEVAKVIKEYKSKDDAGV